MIPASGRKNQIIEYEQSEQSSNEDPDKNSPGVRFSASQDDDVSIEVQEFELEEEALNGVLRKSNIEKR